MKTRFIWILLILGLIFTPLLAQDSSGRGDSSDLSALEEEESDDEDKQESEDDYSWEDDEEEDTLIGTCLSMFFCALFEGFFTAMCEPEYTYEYEYDSDTGYYYEEDDNQGDDSDDFYDYEWVEDDEDGWDGDVYISVDPIFEKEDPETPDYDTSSVIYEMEGNTVSLLAGRKIGLERGQLLQITGLYGIRQGVILITTVTESFSEGVFLKKAPMIERLDKADLYVSPYVSFNPVSFVAGVTYRDGYIGPTGGVTLATTNPTGVYIAANGIADYNTGLINDFDTWEYYATGELGIRTYLTGKTFLEIGASGGYAFNAAQPCFSVPIRFRNYGKYGISTSLGIEPYLIMNDDFGVNVDWSLSFY